MSRDAEGGPPKVVLCVPTVTKPYDACLDAIEASIPLFQAQGIEPKLVLEVGNPYISAARATMLRKALSDGADIIVFIDHDLSWRPEDLVKLVLTEGHVVAGLYRFKKADEEYMGALEVDADGDARARDDGALLANRVPAGFLKMTREGVARFMRAYPELCYGDPIAPSVDLFNHGAHNAVWWGEDYAFSRRWRETGEPLWVVPDLSLTHHSATEAYPGNFHDFLRRQPGGDLHQEAA